MFEIPAGGRRFRALELLVKQKRLARNALVPCVVREKGSDKERHHSLGLVAIRFLALTDSRRGDAIALQWNWIDAANATLCLGDSKTGESVRPIGRAALELLDGLPCVSDHVFAAGAGRTDYQGLPNIWRLVQATSRSEGLSAASEGPLDGITLHSFRHSFASHADELGCSMSTRHRVFPIMT